MKKKLFYSILLFFLMNTTLYSQKITKDNYTFLVQKEWGDLNKDGVNDKVMVEMDTLNQKRPLRLQIFLSRPNKQVQLMMTSTKIIESQYPTSKKEKHNGNPIPDFFIEEGNLQMLTDINNRKSSYTFRYRNGNFELTKILRVKWKGKETTHETEIDLMKGTKKEYDRDYSPNDKNVKNTKLSSMNSLPKIQNLSFSDLEKY